MPLPSPLSFVGVAKESTKGTGVAATAYLPLMSFDPFDHYEYYEDTAIRGAMGDVYSEVQGPAWGEIAATGPVFVDTFPWFLANVCGDYAGTGAGPYTHTIAQKNSGDGQPGAVSLTDYFGLSGGTPSRRYPGCQIAGTTLKWGGVGVLEHSTNIVGFKSALVAKPTQSFGALPPIAGWSATLSIAAGSKTFLESAELNIKRLSCDPIHTADGTQDPYAVWVGPLGVDGKMTIIAEDETEFLRYTGGTSAVLVVTFTQGTASITITMSKVQYTNVQLKRGGPYAVYDVTFKAVQNTTDVGATGGYSPAKFVVVNSITSGTYA